jgi:hypothetical protein
MRLKRTVLVSMLALAATASPLLAADAPSRVPTFVEETAASGVTSVYAGDWEFMVGGGATTFDCNDDRFPDLYLAGGEQPSVLYRNVGTQGGPLRFEPQTSGLELQGVTGSYPLDIDGDGVKDLIVLRVGENMVMRGLGGCKFERANEAWGFDGGAAWSAAFAATFEKGAVWPTLAIGNYIDRREESFPWGSCTDNWLHRPALIDGKPQRKFAPPLPLKPSYCALSMLFTDWNRSGKADLRVSNDREYYKGGQEQMWRVPPGEAPTLYSEQEGWKYLRIWGMGIASYDLDFDGYPEYFLTSMADNKLQTLAAIPAKPPVPPTYVDKAFAKGVTAHRPYTGEDLRPSTAWHAQFEDVNNDGLADLFVAKGNVAKMPDFAEKDPNNLLIQQKDGKFIEAGDKSGVLSFGVARGAVLADLNLDGLMDLVVVNRWESAKVWRNTSADAGRWLQIELRQDGPNRDAIGAWIEVKRDNVTMRREITSGGGHAGGHLGWWHVGVGDRAQAEIRVVWPDGEAGPWSSLATNAFYVLERGKEPKPWVAGKP